MTVAPLWRTVRVFLSSTFRDMHAERDHLVKVCFPRLRRWCEDRCLHLIDIDLRWGITRAEAESGRAVDLCRQEIDNSRPFFLCLLGEQYGTVPAQDGQNLPLSITHLEIRHAALDAAPADTPEAFFYLRDPASLPAPNSGLIPEGDRAAYRATFLQQPPEPGQPDLRLRLEALKTAIRERFGPLDRVRDYAPRWDAQLQDPNTPAFRGRLAGFEALTDMIEQDLQRAITARFADHLAALDQPPDAAAQEAALQEAFVEDRVRMHLPDPAVQGGIEAFVAADTPGLCCVTGPAGSGKSAALAYWLRGRALPSVHRPTERDDTVVLYRAVGASADSGQWPDLVRSLWSGLAERLPAGKLGTPSADPVQLQRDWAEALKAAAGAFGRLILILDGLDQLDGNPARAGQALLPDRLPGSVRIVIGLAPGPQSQGWHELIAERKATMLEVAPLDDTRCGEILNIFPGIYAKSLDDRQIARLLENPASRNPLFLTVALRELRLFGSFDRLEDAVAGLPRSGPGAPVETALQEIFGRMFQRIEADQPPALRPLVGATLSALSLSRRGLSEDGLSRFLIWHHPTIAPGEVEATMLVVLRQMRPYLSRRQAPDGVLLGFFHRAVVEAVGRQYLAGPALRQKGRAELMDWLATRPWFDDTGSPDAAKTLDLPWLCLRAAEEGDPAAVARLSAMFSDWDTLDAKYRAGYLRELSSDLDRTVALLAEGDPARARLVLVAQALRIDIDFIERHRHDYPQGLLQCLWNRLWWHDHPEAGGHFAMHAGALDGQLATWIEACRKTAALRCPEERWLRQLRPGLVPLGTGARLRLTGFPDAVTHVAWSPDGSRLYAACPKTGLHVFETDSGAEFQRIALPRPARSMAISPDGQRIAIGSGDTVTRETITEYSASGQRIAVYQAHAAAVHQLAYAQDGRHLVAGSTDGTISVWSLDSGELRQRRGVAVGTSRTTEHNLYFDLVPGSTRLVCGGMAPEVHVWDWDSGRDIQTWISPQSAIGRLRVSPNGRFCASFSGYEGNSGLWVHDIRTGAAGTRIAPEDGMGGPFAWSPDGSHIAKVDGATKDLVLYRPSDGERVATLAQHQTIINSIAFAPDGRRIAIAAGDKLARRYGHDSTTFEVTVSDTGARASGPALIDHEHPVSALAYTPDGSRLISFSQLPTLVYRTEPLPVRLWDAASMLPAGARRIDEGVSTFLPLPGTGQAVTSGPCNTFNETEQTAIRLWDLGTMRSRFRARLNVRLLMLPSNDGRRLWVKRTRSGAKGQIEVGLPGFRFRRNLPAMPICETADGRAIVAWGGKGIVVHDARDMRPLMEFTLSSRPGLACFSRDGTRFAHSDGYDIVLRDWPSGREIARTKEHSSEMTHLRFSQGDRWLISASRARVALRAVDGMGPTLDGRCDLARLAAASPEAGLVPVATDSELQIIDLFASRLVAVAPGAWEHPCSHPDQRRWSAANAQHLASWHLMRMDEPLPAPAPLPGNHILTEPPARSLTPRPDMQPGPMSRLRGALWRLVSGFQ